MLLPISVFFRKWKVQSSVLQTISSLCSRCFFSVQCCLNHYLLCIYKMELYGESESDVCAQKWIFDNGTIQIYRGKRCAGNKGMQIIYTHQEISIETKNEKKKETFAHTVQRTAKKPFGISIFWSRLPTSLLPFHCTCCKSLVCFFSQRFCSNSVW